jgi:hypothetical protein
MIERLRIALCILATVAGAGEMQSPADSEAAKKERMYQEWVHKVREGIAQMETNLPAGYSLTNLANSPEVEEIARGIFESNWIHSSFGQYWDDIPAPTVRGSNATAEVDRFIAENGWHMLTNEWLFLITINESGKPIKGLPWEVIRDRTFKAATVDGILYIPLRGYMPMGSSGLAYNPLTNRFRAVRDFKPIGDHWYVWSQTDEPINDQSYYEGETLGSANKQGGANGSQPIRSQTNSTSSAAGSRRSP